MAAPQAAAYACACTHGFVAASQARPCLLMAPLMAAKQVCICPHLGDAQACTLVIAPLHCTCASVAAPCMVACQLHVYAQLYLVPMTPMPWA